MNIRDIIQRDGPARIGAYRAYDKRWCSSDDTMRRVLNRMHGTAPFARARFRVGSVVRSTMCPGLYLVVGHGFTGITMHERGCLGCKITDRVHRKSQWVGPDSTLMAVKKEMLL